MLNEVRSFHRPRRGERPAAAANTLVLHLRHRALGNPVHLPHAHTQNTQKKVLLVSQHNVASRPWQPSPPATHTQRKTKTRLQVSCCSIPCVTVLLQYRAAKANLATKNTRQIRQLNGNIPTGNRTRASTQTSSVGASQRVPSQQYSTIQSGTQTEQQTTLSTLQAPPAEHVSYRTIIIAMKLTYVYMSV